LEGLTGFRPRTPLAEIIDRVMNYFKEKDKEERVVGHAAVAND
jgi:hypothetical protein